jgi:hypothetical protein
MAGRLAALAAATMLSGCYLVGKSQLDGVRWGVRTEDPLQQEREQTRMLTAVSSDGKYCRGTVSNTEVDEEGDPKNPLVVLACTRQTLSATGNMREVEVGLGRIEDATFNQSDGTQLDGYIIHISWMGSPHGDLDYRRTEEVRLIVEMDDEAPTVSEIDRAIAAFPRD